MEEINNDIKRNNKISDREMRERIYQLFGQELPENVKGKVEVTEKEREQYEKLKKCKILFWELTPKAQEMYDKLEAKIRMADGEIAENDAENDREWDAENDGEFEVGEIPQELADFREKRKEDIDLDEDKKKAIIEAVDKIPHKATIELDSSRLLEFELWWKKYKCLDVNLKAHSDSEYLTSNEYNRQKNDEVKLWWMMWDDTSERKNRELAEYVEEQRNNRDMDIPRIEFQRDLINKLWETAGLTGESDKIAMWMYLTWNYWDYRLSMWDNKKSGSQGSRSNLVCSGCNRYFSYDVNDGNDASLCLIACQ